MKQQLTLEHIAWYLPHGLKFISDMDKPECEYGAIKIHTCNGAIELFGDMCINSMEYNDAYAVPSCVPILVPMSDLTKPFVKDGVETTHLQELAKMCSNNFLSSYIRNGNCYSFSGIYCLEYVHNSFIMHQVNGCHYCGVLNQLTLFQYLAKHKFDFNGLIDAGLAIDVNTLENNVYN